MINPSLASTLISAGGKQHCPPEQDPVCGESSGSYQRWDAFKALPAVPRLQGGVHTAPYLFLGALEITRCLVPRVLEMV